MELAQYGRIIDGSLFIEIAPVTSALYKSGKAFSHNMTDDVKEGYYTALIVLGDIASEIKRELDSVQS